MTDLDLCTPLHLASYRGLAEVAQALVGAGAKVDAVDRYGNNPLELRLNKMWRAWNRLPTGC